ncbi:hypothetical protein GCM10007981_00720 [Thermocladium modestius]|uniref:Nidogen G2 beta-barrel domain-containing protein n=1 Tax=Thermocladium modestius TaxID=62609 RepID=A0A830GQR1_9CREN|nr:hypothetical protein [Thermocladium modestius]GGP18962.1 hypothetical protein GCM10007981_00720 [Thermocladium modestius]
MVTPLEVEVLESQPGEVEAAGNIEIMYRIMGVKAARVGDGYNITVVGIYTASRFKSQPQQVVGACIGNIPYRPVPFNIIKLAHATIKVEGRVFDIFVEPIAVMIADAITPFGEPCIAMNPVIGWSLTSSPP